jgi:MFS family permease
VAAADYCVDEYMHKHDRGEMVMQSMQSIAGSGGSKAKIGFWLCTALLAPAYYPILGLFAFGTALPPIAAAFAGDPHAPFLSQLIGSVVSFSFALASPLIGRLIDRYGYRMVLIISAVTYALIGGLGGLLDNLYWILATRVLLGFTISGTLIASLTAIGALPEALRARVFGYQVLVGGALAIFMYPLVGYFATLGWRWPFALHLIGLLLLPLFLVLPKAEPVRRAAKVASGARLAGVPVLLLAAAVFMGMAGIAASLYSPFLMTQNGITNPSQQSLALMAMGLAAIGICSIFGWVHRKLGSLGTFSAGFAIFGAGFIMVALSHSLAAFMVSLAVCSVGMTMFAPTMYAAVVDKAGTNSGRALGLANGVYYGAQAFFPVVSAGITRSAGPAAVFSVLGCLALAVAVAYLAAAVGSGRTQASRESLAAK